MAFGRLSLDAPYRRVSRNELCEGVERGSECVQWPQGGLSAGTQGLCGWRIDQGGEAGDSSRGQVTQLMITHHASHLKDCAVCGDTDQIPKVGPDVYILEVTLATMRMNWSKDGCQRPVRKLFPQFYRKMICWLRLGWSSWWLREIDRCERHLHRQVYRYCRVSVTMPGSLESFTEVILKDENKFL